MTKDNPVKDLLIWTEDDRKKILKHFNRDPESIKKDIQIIRDWLKEQPHLPKVELSDQRIETMLIYNKVSLEKTKEKLDMYFTVRSIIPEFFTDNVPLPNPVFSQQEKECTLVPLRHLTKEGNRILVLRYNENCGVHYDPVIHMRHIVNMNEVRLDFDVHNKLLIIADFEHINLSCVSRLTIPFLKKLNFLVEKAYSDRTTNIHIVTLPSILESLKNMGKHILKQKLLDRLIFHNNFESLHEHVDKRILPKDYGGDDWTLREISDAWLKATAKYSSWLEIMDKAKVDESLRPEKRENDEILGFYGTFRQLNLD